MKLLYYKSDVGNLGDDLNPWLWERLLGKDSFFDTHDTCLISIGSLLAERSGFINEAMKYKKKLVIGTGVRSSLANIALDSSWDVQFVRGPLSAARVNAGAVKSIADGAYGITLLDEYKTLVDTPKLYKVSYIPYFRSMHQIDWKKICDRLSWNLISPLVGSIDERLKAIAASKLVISEALHGSILADALRVPWKRAKYFSHMHEGEHTSEFKWNDWLQSIEMQSEIIDIPYLHSSRSTNGPLMSLKNSIKSKSLNKQMFAICEALDSHETISPQISEELKFLEIVSGFSQVVENLKSLNL